MPHEQWLLPEPHITPSLLHDRQQEVNLLIDTEPLLYQHQDLASLLDQLSRLASDLLNSSHGLVYSHNSDTGPLQIQAAAGFRGALPRKVSQTPSSAERLWEGSDRTTLVHGDVSAVPNLSSYPFGDQSLTVLSTRIESMGRPWGVLQVARPSDQPYTESDAQLIYILARRASNALQIQQNSGHQRPGLIDPVTQLPTREFFQEQFQCLAQRSKRLDESISMLLLDIDGLDAINKSLGYVKGDEVLAEIASVVRRTLRMEDLLGRHHSDEFLVGLPGADKQKASLVATRIQDAIGRAKWHPAVGQEAALPTLSVSIASCPEDGTTSEVLLQTASEILQQGDRVRQASETVFRVSTPDLVAQRLNIAIPPKQSEDMSWSELNTDLLWLGMALAAGAVGSTRASVMLLDPSGKQLTLQAGKGFQDVPDFRAISQDVGTGIAGRVAATGQPILLSDVTESGYASSFTDNYRTRSCLSVPIRNGQVIGILNLTDKHDGQEFSTTDLDTVMRLGQAIAEPHHSPRVTLLESAASMCRALEQRYPDLAGHSDQVADCAVLMGKQLGLKQKELQHLRESGWLHDLGEFEIRPQMHSKTDVLQESDWSAIHNHPELGYELCDAVRFLRGYRDTIRQHHERPDGKGYPHAQTVGKLSLESRILAVAEAFVGMCSPRSYRPGLTVEQALNELHEHAGTKYDEESVTALTRSLADVPDFHLPASN